MTAKTADLRPALRAVYLMAFDKFAVTAADVVEQGGIDPAEARALLKRLVRAGLLVSDHVNGEPTLVYQTPETYDTISRWTAIRRFDKVYPKGQPVESRTGGTHKGATGPRYSDEQIKKGKAAREAGKSWVEVAKAAGVKSDGHFSRVLRSTFPELALKQENVKKGRGRKEAAARTVKANAKAKSAKLNGGK